jgi:hypothetical protein
MTDYEKKYNEVGFHTKYSSSNCYSPEKIGKELMRDFARKDEITYTTVSKNNKDIKISSLTKCI